MHVAMVGLAGKMTKRTKVGFAISLGWMMSMAAFRYAAHLRATITSPLSVQQNALRAPGAILTTIKATARIQRESAINAGAARRPRVYCMVPTLEEAEQKEYWKVILETWGHHCDVIRFFVDGDKEGQYYYFNATVTAPEIMTKKKQTALQAKVVQINTRRTNNCDGKPCRHLWEKIWRCWQFVDRHDGDKADWFVKVDTDTFFFPENLRRYVTRMKFDPSQQHFFGHRLRHLRPTYTIAGSSSVFSRATLRLLSNSTGVDVADRDCRDSAAELEEPIVGACLRNNGVEARDAFDEDGKEQFMIFQPMHHLQIYPPKDGKPGKNWPNSTDKENDWFLGHGNPQTNWGKDYPSESPIAFHAFKGPAGRVKMKALYSLFTDPRAGNQGDVYKYDEESKERDYFMSLDSGFPPLADFADIILENLNSALKDLPPIPKKIHLTWKDKKIATSNSTVVLNGLRNLIDLNPDWTWSVSDDADVDEYLKSKLELEDWLLIKEAHIVEKTDLWRLLKIYHEGGK